MYGVGELKDIEQETKTRENNNQTRCKNEVVKGIKEMDTVKCTAEGEQAIHEAEGEYL